MIFDMSETNKEYGEFIKELRNENMLWFKSFAVEYLDQVFSGVWDATETNYTFMCKKFGAVTLYPKADRVHIHVGNRWLRGIRKFFEGNLGFHRCDARAMVGEFLHHTQRVFPEISYSHKSGGMTIVDVSDTPIADSFERTLETFLGEHYENKLGYCRDGNKFYINTCYWMPDEI